MCVRELEKARPGIKCGDGPHDGSCSRMQERLTCSEADDEAEERERLGKTRDLAADLGETHSRLGLLLPTYFLLLLIDICMCCSFHLWFILVR